MSVWACCDCCQCPPDFVFLIGNWVKVKRINTCFDSTSMMQLWSSDRANKKFICNPVSHAASKIPITFVILRAYPNPTCCPWADKPEEGFCQGMCFTPRPTLITL